MIVLALLGLLHARARAQEATKEPPHGPSWTISTDGEDEAPEAPLVKAQAGIVLWPYLKTSIKIDRKKDLTGRELSNAEDHAGLPSRWVSPWVDVSIGTWIRGCASWLDLDRQGTFVRSGEEIDVGAGRILARKGDYVAVGVHYTQVDVAAQWDFLSGKRYRIGVLGGARLVRLATRIAGVRAPLSFRSIAANDYLVSPIVGGQFELAPVPLFTMFASIHFVDWAWKEIRLREERTFEIHVGCSVTLIEDMLSASFDMRFLSVFVNPSDLNGGKNLAQYELDAGGIGLSVFFRY